MRYNQMLYLEVLTQAELKKLVGRTCQSAIEVGKIEVAIYGQLGDVDDGQLIVQHLLLHRVYGKKSEAIATQQVSFDALC